jgi:ATP-dependent Clp protease ATP-binding subunit ClpC
MLERLTVRGRALLVMAHAEACRRTDSAVDTEHLLFALIDGGGGVAAIVLEELLGSFDQIRAALEAIMPPRALEPGKAKLPPTAAARRVVAVAITEADNLQDSFAGTEHLLLGLIREESGVAAKVLRKLGVSPEQVRERMRRYVRARAS